MTGKRLLLLLILLLFCFHATAVSAANITSEVNSDKITLNDNLILTVTVSDSNAKPKLEPMPDFNITGTSTMTSIQIINFKSSSSTTYTYILVPKKTGAFNVGAASIKSGNGRISAQAAKVEVVQGSRSSAQNPQGAKNAQSDYSDGDGNIFIKSSIDNKEPFVGEQVTFSFELYNRLALIDTQYEPPTTTGFWTVEIPQASKIEQMKVYNNKRYYYYTNKTALFPTTSGELTIGPASLTYTTQGGFFSFGDTETLRSKPLKIKVKPLPEAGKPKDFSGAVGNFKISVKTGNTNVKAGDVVTLEVNVIGQGNLDLITSLTSPDLTDFKTYSPKTTGKISTSGYVIGGQKTWEYVVIPKKPGNFIIQPFSLSYFNPQDKSYYTIKTEPIELKVQPGDATSVSQPQSGSPTSSMLNIGEDIRYIKPDKKILKDHIHNVSSSVFFYFLYVIPLGIFTASAFYRRRQNLLEKNTGLKRKLNAWKNAHKRLDEASKLYSKGDTTAFCGKLHESITIYIGDMLNLDTGSLVSSDIEKMLIKNGISADYAVHIRKTLEMCDFIRFASSGPNSDIQNKILKDTAEIFTTLREKL